MLRIYLALSFSALFLPASVIAQTAYSLNSQISSDISEFKLTYSLDGKKAYHHLVFTGDEGLDAASHLKFTNDLRDDSSDTRISCDPRLPLTLAEIQRRTGEHIVIYSGYRTKENNDSVNGAPRSHHLNCSAVDFQLINYSAKEAAIVVVAVMDDLWGKHFGGVGVNHTTLHIDAGNRRFWKRN